MPWFKIGPHLFSHQAWIRCSVAARALWTTAGSYCAAHSPEGFVPREVLSLLRAKPRHAAELVTHGLWEEVDGGWRFVPQPAGSARIVFTISTGDLREKIPGWMREAVLERDGLLCGLCGGDVEPDDVHLDHIQPVTRGGRNRLSNLQVAHSRCNIRKGNRV